MLAAAQAIAFGDAAFDGALMRPAFADHRIDDAPLAAVRARFERHVVPYVEPDVGPQGAPFTRPMHVRLLRRRG